jgi:hypothetical protein
MNLHNIDLDVIYELNEREIYRFITEELIEEELNVFDVPGMTSCFIYEEFYPNHEEDVKRYSIEFLDSLLKKKFEFMHFNIAQQLQINGEKTSTKVFVEKAQGLMKNAEDIILPSFEIKSVTFSNDTAEIKCAIAFEKINHTKSNIKQKLTAHLFYYYDFGYWYMNRFILPELGFN